MKPRTYKLVFLALLAITLCLMGHSQNQKEQIQALNKPSKKGMLYGVELMPNGGIKINYAVKGDKKSDENVFESYSFDKDLNFLGSTPFQEPKEENPPIIKTGIGAYAGGSNAVNVLSQKLSIYRAKYDMVWDYGSQKYVRTKTISKESVKLGNNEGRYKGYAEFYPDKVDGAIVIASAEQGKKSSDQFVCLFIDFDVKVTETPITEGGSYSLSFAGELSNGNVFVIMAPQKSMPNTSEYVYAEFGLKGELITRTKFNAPSPNMAVMDFKVLDGSLYMVAVSMDGKKTFEETLTDFSSISNPNMGASWATQKYTDALYSKDFDSFHFIKLNKGIAEFASTTAIKDFKKKVKTPPSQKKEHTYTGKKLYFANMGVAPNGDYFVAGQLMVRKIIKEEMTTKYLDFIALHFDSKGNLKAQYAVEKVNNETKSEVFYSPQNFFFSADGNSATWEILEVKGTEGYLTFFDGFYGRSSYIANYFPRLLKINLASSDIQNPVTMGAASKCYMYPLYSDKYDASTHSRYYIGHDNDYKKLWVGMFNIE